MTETFETETLVIGAGVIGLACARALAMAGRSVTIIEANPAVGQETSSRNSEVIHAGLYYPPDSVKAATCAAGRRMLYAYCAARGVAYKKCGKLVVSARADQTGALEDLQTRGAANGAGALRLLSAAEARAMQPNLQCAAALLSPESGVIDSHAYMLALLADAEAAGAVLALNTPAAGGELTQRGADIFTGGAAPAVLRAREVIITAGHGSAPLARKLGLAPPETRVSKGNYFRLAAPRAPFTQLIYPLPEPGGLGVHVTLDMAGQCRFGPDVEWPEDGNTAPGDVDMNVNPARAGKFYERIREYWPGLPDGALAPDYAGLRPKLSGPGEANADFRIDGPGETGAPGVTALYGIESPGLTASLAIAEHVAAAGGGGRGGAAGI
ncbi:MAG: NAD(P)/FAD-dependent oxidoreductase [Rhodospirillales bacterium]